ncbi:APC family permease [Robertkochia aurantiaca]|uniref:APC family permease n=1 Tax=Robertkochia aurantiaca TaxID=2873700 RepID=UPI001CC927CF|nr:APC family permease [Robertkochia sp. 3YJGBD-33]
MNTENLKRTVGFSAATAIGLGAMLGAGIFVFPGLAGGKAGFAAIISFLIGGAIALAAAICTAELSTAMPQSGGGYFFISRSFGRFWGTLTGIGQWVGLIFACAFYLVSFGEYAVTLFEELGINGLGFKKLWAFCFTLLLLLLNILGTKKVGRIQNIMIISLTAILVTMLSYGIVDLFLINERTAAFDNILPDSKLTIFTTTALIFTSYLGFVQIANISAEIRQPAKNLPRSLIGSVLIATALYAFVMTVCTFTFTREELKNFGETATIEVAREILGNWGAVVILIGGLLAALSSANASVISASRGVFALSKDRLISKKASKINKRFGTPHISLLLVCLPVAVMLMRSDLAVFAEVASFLHLMIYGAICLSVLKLRRENPTWYVPAFKVPGSEFIAGFGAVSCFSLVFFMQKTSILISLGILVLASIYYLVYVRKINLELHTPVPPHIDPGLFSPNILVPIDITAEKKDLPYPVLKAMPESRLLLLGFKETPEQSESEQSEEEYGEEGKEKLKSVTKHLEDADYDFESELIFSNDIKSQIEQVIETEDPNFILTLKPLSELQQIVIPIYNQTQINNQLNTIVHNLQENKTMTIKVLLFPEEKEDGASNETQLKKALEQQLGLIHARVDDYEIFHNEKSTPEALVQKISDRTDLVIWPEADPGERQVFLNNILEKESIDTSSPIIMILKKKSDQK